MAKIVGFADVWEKWIKEQNCNADEFIPMSFRARISNDALKTNKQKCYSSSVLGGKKQRYGRWSIFAILGC